MNHPHKLYVIFKRTLSSVIFQVDMVRFVGIEPSFMTPPLTPGIGSSASGRSVGCLDAVDWGVWG